MFYSKPVKNEDGLYIVNAYTDEKTKYFVPLDGTVKADSGELTFTVEDDSKFQEVDTLNIEAAKENSEEWFGKKMIDATLERAYTTSVLCSQVTADIIPQTKAFDYNKHSIELGSIEDETKVKALLEFAGLWFAKKAYGPIWNVVQVRDMTEPEPEPEPEVEIQNEYPDEYVDH
jgi:hypothetical protein